jgi:esterase/lipase superfamily enzyme
VRLQGVLRGFGLAAIALAIGVTDAAADVDPLLVDRAAAEIAGGDADAGFAMLEEAIRSPGPTPAEQIDLLAELARLRLTNGDFADAGEALAFQAEATARLEGASAPELAGLYAGAADAYLRAGSPQIALDLARRALEIDVAYHDCGSPLIGRDHARLADILGALGKDAEAEAERALADNADGRCGVAGPAESRGVVVNDEFASATPDSFARVKIYYATDRLPTGSDRPNEYFGSERGELQYGTVEVTVPRIHKPGEVESPSLIKLEWTENQERHFVITRIETLSGEAMFADMRTTLAERNSDEAFVFVHGFNVPFAHAAKQTAQIAYDLNFTGAPVLYSWPSAGSTFAYVRDEAVVRLSGRRLLRFLDVVVERSGARRINLIAHSMGNRALLDALELLATRRGGAGDSDAVFNEIIFAAPDEDAALFSEMLATIRPVARRLTLYGSDSDLALEVSKRLHGDLRRAGQGGTGILISDAVDSIDMTAVGDDMLKHGYFSGSASALTDISWMFWRDTPPDRRCGMDAKDLESGLAWVFDPIRCDGPVMLSALTLLKAEGANALAKIEKILSALSGGNQEAAEEWNAIRDAVAAAQP